MYESNNIFDSESYKSESSTRIGDYENDIDKEHTDVNEKETRRT